MEKLSSVVKLPQIAWNAEHLSVIILLAWSELILDKKVILNLEERGEIVRCLIQKSNVFGGRGRWQGGHSAPRVSFFSSQSTIQCMITS